MAEDDTEMRDGEALEEEHLMYGQGAMTEQELDEKYPNRPHNHSKTLNFSELYLTLFNPLEENKRKRTGPGAAGRRHGRQGKARAPNEIKRSIVETFISRWRKEVGNDIYPAFRLIAPEKDRDRAMYGLKELTLGKLLIRIMKIDKNSDDGYNLTHWKLPGVKASSVMAGDFAGRCFEVINKRPMRTLPGTMTIAEVNELLDKLSVAQKEENQLPILEEFYNRMNAEELTWLIRMIMRQMKIGVTEKTIFDLWHPDAENLFNISSNLRRVCWELTDWDIRLEGDKRGLCLMQCFQPQLATFKVKSMEHLVNKMKPTEEDPVFWVEEKLDGERMQLHMMEDNDVAGGKRFGFWSRKAKDYTYLYGNGFEDDQSALTRHIKSAFRSGVRNIILDGEMISWDAKEQAVVPFGSLKTAALAQQNNPFFGGSRPVYCIFDCLYLNDVDLTRYTLRKRREALNASIESIERRFEIHKYVEAQRADEIQPMMRNVVAVGSEGIVVKSPRSEYRLNDRNEDWIKVKPEYMTDSGESFDCVVIGGYYGSGKRGGGLSSFLCGLRVDQPKIDAGESPMKCESFFKVGGGFAASDYAEVRHRTEGKWIDFDSKKPPNDFILLGGDGRLFEKPDVWIKPCDSIVLSVKGASVGKSKQFGSNLTLRFPRLKRIRTDKTWEQALSVQEFLELRHLVDEEAQEKQFKIEEARRIRNTSKRKRQTIILQGNEDDIKTPYAGPTTKVFNGLNFLIMTEALKPKKKSKAELEQFIKANGGSIVASDKDPKTILIADRNLVKVASTLKRDQRNLIRPSWLFDCVKQGELDIGRPSLLLPFEPHHFFHTISAEARQYDGNIDEYGDSYTRDLTTEELLALFNNMPTALGDSRKSSRNRSTKQVSRADILNQLIEEASGFDALPGRMFHNLIVYSEGDCVEADRLIQFAGGQIVDNLEIDEITHVLVSENNSRSRLNEIRKSVSSRTRLPRIVTEEWALDSWRAKTLLDEERACIDSIHQLPVANLI